MVDPAIARARLEIASDQALIRKLASDEVIGGPTLSSQTRDRITALKRLIAANRTLLERLND